MDIEIFRSLIIPDSELRELASRASGPGGQHVNKTSTRVTLRWRPADSEALSDEQRARLLEQLEGRLTRSGEIVVDADRFRSRARNRELASERLAEIVREALHEAAPRKPTRPTRGSKERRHAAKARRGEIKAGRGKVRRPSDD